MVESSDLWYIRFPDGRILRARSTQAVRRALQSGRIPWNCRARRSGAEPWQPLVRTLEFADIAPASNAGAEESSTGRRRARQRKRAGDLRTLGVRGLVEELFNAYDSSLHRNKLTTAGITGLAIGAVLAIGDAASSRLGVDWAWAGYLATAIVLLILLNLCSSVLTQMTTLELSRFRPASFSEIRPGLFVYAARLTGAVGLIAGSILGLTVLLHFLRGGLAPADNDPPAWGLEAFLHAVNGARLLLGVICCPILGFTLFLMGPIFIVEDYSIGRGLREWANMLRQYLIRIYLYQAIAFAFAAVVTLPLVVPVLVAFGFADGNARALSLGESVALYMLFGVAFTPMLAYLLVAHVFIYLNLRYEFYYSALER
jgi:hypothetical protein